MKVVDTQVIAGWCGVDTEVLDEKKLKKYLRDMQNKNMTYLFRSEKYAFYIKEAKQSWGHI